MSRIESFARFLWDFVVGDDWRIAVGVVIALGASAVLAGAGVATWWIPPAAAVAMLAVSVWRA
jgi:hypothetical protein